jgi:hydroxymethylpyrimidine pyrophosphatase-like HAD family hydrolase
MEKNIRPLHLQQLTAAVCEIARKAGEYIAGEREKFSLERVERKHAHDYVSYVDKGSEDLIVSALRQLLELAETCDLPIEFSVDSRLYLTERSMALQQEDPGLVFHRDTILVNHGITVDSLELLCEKSVEKVNLLCIPAEKREGVLEGLKQIPVSAVWSSHNCMEITHPDAHKGRGLEEACRLLDIPVEATMALGDSGNDESMLKAAGLGVAMGNAPDFIKAVADAVTERTENDGAAIAIERYALNL